MLTDDFEMASFDHEFSKKPEDLETKFIFAKQGTGPIVKIEVLANAESPSLIRSECEGHILFSKNEKIIHRLPFRVALIPHDETKSVHAH